MDTLRRAIVRSFRDELSKIAEEVAPTVPQGVPPPAPAPAPSGKKPPSWATEHAEHVTDLGGLGIMGVASADELREALTGNSALGTTGRELANLAGLATMAAPSIQAARHLRQQGASRKGVAGGGSLGVNVTNLAALGALGLPILDRLQARARGRPEEGRFLSDRQSAISELLGYGAFGANTLRARQGTTGAERAAYNRQLAGYGLLAMPEAAHAIDGEHPEHPNYDEYGNLIPPKPSAFRALTDLTGLGLLAQPVAGHLMQGKH